MGMGKSGSGFGGNSQFDLSAIMQALGMNIQDLHNRYAQLGLGVPESPGGAFGPTTGPGGIGAQAANAGQSLQYGGPGTPEQQDVGGLQQMASAALGTLQNQNQNNPAISGTPANTLQGINNLNTSTQNNAFSTGASQPTGIPSGP